MILQSPPRDGEHAPQHELLIFLRTFAGHRNLLTPHLDIEAHAKIVAALMMAVRNVGNHMAGDDAGN